MKLEKQKFLLELQLKKDRKFLDSKYGEHGPAKRIKDGFNLRFSVSQISNANANR